MPRTVRIGLSPALPFPIIPAPFAAVQADLSIGDSALPLMAKDMSSGNDTAEKRAALE